MKNIAEKTDIRTLGVVEVLDIVRVTRDKEAFQSGINALVDRGQMRWDDQGFLENLRKFSKLKTLDALNLQVPVDMIFGEGRFNIWHGNNSRAYEEKSRVFHELGKTLENDPKKGGVAAHFSSLLKNNMSGQFVDPHEYDGLLRFAFELGKMSLEEKIFFLLTGIAQGILTLDTFGTFNGKYLSVAPFLEYFTDKSSQKRFQDGDKNRKNFTYTQDEIKKLGLWLTQDPTRVNGGHGRRTLEFIDGDILQNPKVIARANKSLQSPQKIDRDDASNFIPLITAENTLKITQASDKGEFSLFPESCLDAYPGYQRYMASAAKKGSLENLLRSIKAFVYFDGILFGESIKNDRYMRLTHQDLERSLIGASQKARFYREKILKMIDVVAKKMNMKSSRGDYKKFAQELDIKVKKDGGAGLLKIVRAADLSLEDSKDLVEQRQTHTRDGLKSALAA